ncbi:gamma-glutamylcyclotransferase-like [Scaptodrosophila lebanonensis]|uniref:gamma-glutamylcyclotransferase n=1 Tax=Drosophila lebanonensis TaxID=7225 RepID=A0A6J2T9E1_DROLE|nr:gamma-glutamylcyclotransferase-like [Scaptodrosophila lebanonensis]
MKPTFSKYITMRLQLTNVFQLLIYMRLACSCSSSSANTRFQELPEVHGTKFYYFGYGSNMLSSRIHINNPTAVKIGPALLHNFRLDFAQFTQRWKGAVGTIVPTPDAETWGTLWEIDLVNLPDIDNQEGVHLGTYVPLTVNVELRNRTTLPARCYHLVEQPATNLHNMVWDQVPDARQPSKTYLQCLVKGSIESGIPNEYVQFLQAIRHNGRVAKGLEEKLQLAAVELLQQQEKNLLNGD